MEDLLMTGTAKTPDVEFRADGHLLLQGCSIPENAPEFYRPLLSWLEDYGRVAKPVTELTVKFNYFNSSSSKALLQLIEQLSEIQTAEHKVQVRWLYEEGDDDNREAGEDYMDVSKIPFTIESYK